MRINNKFYTYNILLNKLIYLKERSLSRDLCDATCV